MCTDAKVLKRYLKLLEDDGNYFVDLIRACKDKLLEVAPKEYYLLYPRSTCGVSKPLFKATETSRDVSDSSIKVEPIDTHNWLQIGFSAVIGWVGHMGFPFMPPGQHATKHHDGLRCLMPYLMNCTHWQDLSAGNPCPEECPFIAQVKPFACAFTCVNVTQCHYTDPNMPFANPSSQLCEESSIEGCGCGPQRALRCTSLRVYRRKIRRSRSIARRLWWLNRTGRVQLTIDKLRWIRKTLTKHHSRDPTLLQSITQTVELMAGQQKNAGWLCHWCRVMNGKHALCCHRCGGKWYEVGDDADADYTYWHQSSGKGAQRYREEGQWPTPPQTKGRDGTKTPRPTQQGQPQGNAGNQRRRSRRGKKQSQATEQTPAPSATIQPPQIPSTGGAMSWMTLCNMQQTANQAIAPPEATHSAAAMGTASSSNALPANVKKLLTGLKKDQDKLSPENQELVKTLVVKEERDEEKELQDAVKSLGKARRDLQAAFQARSNLHAKWRQFLSMSVAQWRAFTQEFQAQESDALQKINDAKEAVAQAKNTFESSKETVVFKPENYKPTEVQDLMSDDEGSTEPSTAKLQEGLTNLTSSLQSLHRTAEAAHAEEQAAKKARLGDASDVSGLPGGAQLQPFAQPGMT
eukprot:s2631_g13.t1